MDISDFRLLISDFGLAKKRAFAASAETLVGFVSRRISCLDYQTKGLTGDESMVSDQ
jgi:hypothetical protein